MCNFKVLINAKKNKNFQIYHPVNMILGHQETLTVN